MVKRIINCKIAGFKNIDREIEITFANKVIDNSFFEHSSLKGIYGTNGAGKTGFIQAINLYKMTILNNNYIRYQNYCRSFPNIINKLTNKASIEIISGIFDENESKIHVLKHTIEYRLDGENLAICFEKLSYLKGKNWSIDDKYETIFQSNGVEITYLHKQLNKYKDLICSNTINLINYSSAVYIAAKTVLDQQKDELNEVMNYLVLQTFLAFDINVFTEEKDDDNISLEKYETLIYDMENFFSLGIPRDSIMEFIPVSNEEDVVRKVDYNRYLSSIKKAANFIKVFKPDLVDIAVKCDENGENLVCKKVFQYKNGFSVSSQYESTGIKKLMKLYNTLNAANNGGIAFIDEFDANIHDVYLCAIIDYFKLYSTSSQICFTTHNISSMEILKDLKYSIDFLENNTVVSWIKNGNYSPARVYKAGMISNSHFKLNAADLIEAFGE